MANRLSQKKVKDALIKKKGNVSDVANYLGCTRKTIYNYINKYDDVKTAREDAVEAAIDYVESKLFDQIEKGNITAIIFYLKTIGKSRGYIERQETEQVGEVVFRVVEVDRHSDTESPSKAE